MTTTTKRPTDAEIVKLLRESGAILRKLQLELSGEEFINSPDNRFDVAADALEADDLTERVMDYFNDHYDGIASVSHAIENALRAAGVK